MLKLENVCKYYQSATNPVKALDNINVNFNLDEFVAITGESGSGKSTFLNVITGMDTYEEGEIYFKGNPTSFFDTNDLEEFRKRHVSYILQSYGLIDSYTVIDNIMLPLLINGVDKKEAKERAMNLIKEVDLLDKVNVKVSLLSGGEKQRVSIARALISDKEILACDEITANLDSETSKEIIALVKRLSKGKLVLFVTHDYNAVKDVSTRHIVFSDGKIVMDDKLTLDDELVENLDLNYKPISNKTRFKLAMNNLVACPKKTLFNSMILFTVSIIISLLLLLVSVGVNQTKDPSYLNSCVIRDENYLIYTPDKDIKLKGNINKRAFIESYGINTPEDRYAFTTHTLDPDTLISFEGTKPTRSDEIIAYYSRYANHKLSIGSILTFNNRDYTVTAVGKLNNFSPTIITIDPELNTKLYKYVSINAFQDYVNGLTIMNEYKINIIYNYDDPCYINIPRMLYNNIDSIKIGKFDLMNIMDIKLCNHFTNVLDIYINDEFIDNYFDNFVYSVYSSNINDTNNNIKTLKQNNISYFYPHTDISNDSLDRLSLVVIVILSLIMTALLYFVITAIITRLNNSTIKDYSIYRMLGVSKKDSNAIIMYYNILLSFIIFNLVYFTIFTILHFKVDLRFELSIYLIFLLGIVIFNTMITKNTTKKVYNTSSIKTLKEE